VVATYHNFCLQVAAFDSGKGIVLFTFAEGSAVNVGGKPTNGSQDTRIEGSLKS
jgi:hypothetical protein